MKLLTGLLAAILVLGLMMACNNPAAQPTTPEPAPTTPMEPDPDPEPTEPEPPMVTELDLTLKGWERDTDDAFTWRITINKAQDELTALQADLVFDVKRSPRVTVNNVPATGDAAVLCAGLDALNVMVSGRMVSFSGRATAECDDVFMAFDPRGENNESADDDALAIGDDVMFELELSKLPDTMAALDAKAQEISFDGTVTITHLGGEGANADVDTDDTVDKTESFTFSGTATYDTPTIQPAGN